MGGGRHQWDRKQARKRKEKAIISMLIKPEFLNILLCEKEPDRNVMTQRGGCWWSLQEWQSLDGEAQN